MFERRTPVIAVIPRDKPVDLVDVIGPEFGGVKRKWAIPGRAVFVEATSLILLGFRIACSSSFRYVSGLTPADAACARSAALFQCLPRHDCVLAT
jgi:hypothetical protein